MVLRMQHTRRQFCLFLGGSNLEKKKSKIGHVKPNKY